MSNDLEKMIKKADHIERVSSDEYVITVVDARGVETKATVKKYLSGFTCQWSMTVNGTAWVYNGDIDTNVKKAFMYMQDKAFEFSEDEIDANRENIKSFFANL